MHRVHNMHLKNVNDKIMCEKYINDLFTCYNKDYTIEKEKSILSKMTIYCDQSSFSNKAICSSVNSCGVTLK